MSAGKDNVQVTSILSRDIVKLIDAQSIEEVRSRSQMISKIIIDYYKQKSEPSDHYKDCNPTANKNINKST